MTLKLPNPIEIQKQTQAQMQNQPKGAIKAQGMEFGDFLAGVSAMTPFATEFTRQSTGDVNATNVINAAFASFPASASAFAGGAGPGFSQASLSPYGLPASAQFASGGYSTGMPGFAGHDPQTHGLGSPNAEVAPGTGMTQFQLMETMNQNNLKLIELQAIMQSNMQTWNTKSNILSADHRAKMSMVEKFSARG